MSQNKNTKYKIQNTPMPITKTDTKLNRVERDRSDLKNVYELYIFLIVVYGVVDV